MFAPHHLNVPSHIQCQLSPEHKQFVYLGVSCLTYCNCCATHGNLRRLLMVTVVLLMVTVVLLMVNVVLLMVTVVLLMVFLCVCVFHSTFDV